MIVLGIETSCDETAMAVVADGGLYAAPRRPYVCLSVSVGPTMPLPTRDAHSFAVLGQPVADPAGAAVHQLGRLMGLGFPGGPVIDELAGRGNPHAIRFPRG